MNNNLPRVESNEYFSLMNRVIKQFEKMLPVKVYGFTGYSRVAFYWVLPSGGASCDTCTIPFDVLYALVQNS